MDEPRRITRRRLLAGAGILGTALAADGFLLEPNWLDVTRHTVRVAGLPGALDGYKMAQVTDVHLDSLGLVHEVLLDRLRAEDCQLIAVTGDLIDNAAALADVKELSSQLRAVSPRVVATLGNWEHWSKVPLPDIRELYADTDVELLVNEVSTTDICIAATDDGCTGRADFRGTFAALPGRAPFRLLLTHAPGAIDSAPAPGRAFDLVLSGHTHGGQVQVVDAALMTPPGSGRFVAGWYDTPLGETYVSRGVGMSILDVRFMCRPELAIFELRGA